MNYQSPEDRIERLEKKVAALLCIIPEIIRTNDKFSRSTCNLLGLLLDEASSMDARILATLQFAVEGPNLGVPVKKHILDLIKERQKENAATRVAITELQKTMASNRVVLPEDLFGPQNPPLPPAS